MGRLLLGIILGLVGKFVYDTLRERELPESAADVQRRAAALLEETRQLLEEVRQEVLTVAGATGESAHAAAVRPPRSSSSSSGDSTVATSAVGATGAPVLDDGEPRSARRAGGKGQDQGASEADSGVAAAEGGIAGEPASGPKSP